MPRPVGLACGMWIVACLAMLDVTESMMRAIERVSDAPIVGRASCASSFWLLNRANELFEIRFQDGAIRSIPLNGIGPAASPRGLACLSDGTLWTLEAPRLLARISPHGLIVERVDLRWPRVSLFGVGDRLLFRQLPHMVGDAVLTTALPRRPGDVRAWPGLVGRTGTTVEERLARNLTACGIGANGSVPCWFADVPVVTISDGKAVRSYRVDALRSAGVDQQLPIWDMALLPDGHAWLLATGDPSHNGRRVGRQLLKVDRYGAVQHRVTLNTPARLIVHADVGRCVLLTVEGVLSQERLP